MDLCVFSTARKGGWSTWTKWGPCDRKCTQIRERFCTNKNRTKCPGVDADGIETQTKRCVSEECNGRFQDLIRTDEKVRSLDEPGNDEISLIKKRIHKRSFTLDLRSKNEAATVLNPLLPKSLVQRAGFDVGRRSRNWINVKSHHFINSASNLPFSSF